MSVSSVALHSHVKGNLDFTALQSHLLFLFTNCLFVLIIFTVKIWTNFPLNNKALQQYLAWYLFLLWGKLADDSASLKKTPVILPYWRVWI